MLAIAADTFDKPSETFIRAHVAHIAPGRTVLISRASGGAAQFGCPVLSDVDTVPARRNLRARLGKVLRGVWRSYVDPAMDRRDEARVCAFLRQHGVTVILAEFGRTGARLRRACKRAGIPLFVHFHGSDATKRARSRRWRRHYRHLFRDAAGIIVPSRFLADRVRDLGCPDRKLHVSPNGVELANFSPTIREPGRIVATSRLVPGKGPLQTIEAFQRVMQRIPDVTLDFIGDGKLMQDCVLRAETLGVADAVTFHGAQPSQEVARHLARASLFVQHSVTSQDGWTESFGITFLEAAASEVPVVATRSGGIIETVTDGETGLLVEEHDVDGMADAMCALLGDPARAEAMGRAGRARVKARFTHGHTAARLREIMGLTL